MKRRDEQLGIHVSRVELRAAVARSTGSGRQVEIVRTNENEDSTPCAVRVVKDRTLQVGRAALDRERSDPDSIASDFLSAPSAERPCTFPAGVTITSEQLLAELFQSVQHDFVQRGGTSTPRCVIALPTGWGTADRQLAQRAARSVGFRSLAVVQETLAAAHALLDADGPADGRWLVLIDQGGLALSLIQRSGGALDEVGASFDEDAGSSALDRVIVGALLEPEVQVPVAARGTSEGALPPIVRQRLLREAAHLRVRLVQAVEHDVSLSLRVPGGGRHSIDCLITREAVDTLVMPAAADMTERCEEFIGRFALAPAALTGVIVISEGLLRFAVTDALTTAGWPLEPRAEAELTPLTLPARGAATWKPQRNPARKASPAQGTEARPPVATELPPAVTPSEPAVTPPAAEEPSLPESEADTAAAVPDVPSIPPERASDEPPTVAPAPAPAVSGVGEPPEQEALPALDVSPPARIQEREAPQIRTITRTDEMVSSSPPAAMMPPAPSGPSHERDAGDAESRISGRALVIILILVLGFLTIWWRMGTSGKPNERSQWTGSIHAEPPVGPVPEALAADDPRISAVAAEVRSIETDLAGRGPRRRTGDARIEESRYTVGGRVRKAVRVRVSSDAWFSTEFYFDAAGQLIFVLDAERRLVPWRSASAQLVRYYFVHGALRRWVRADGQAAPETDRGFTATGQRLLREASGLARLPDE